MKIDLKKVYKANTEDIALFELDNFEEKWKEKYPQIALSWKSNWANLSTHFKYPQEIRSLIYTTNTIEGFNRQLRKSSKSRSVFPQMIIYSSSFILLQWISYRNGLSTEETGV